MPETRHIGNMDPAEINDRTYNIEHGMPHAPTIAEDWQRKGITYEFTEPVATEAYTSAQLHAMGYVGILLTYPDEQSDK